jgi:hypothetical protein
MNIYNQLCNFILDYKIKKKYISHNKKIFSNSLIKNKEAEVLLEFNAFSDFHVASSVVGNFLKKKYDCNIYSFFNYALLSAPLKFNLINKLKWWMGNFFSLSYFGIYKSFGSKNIFKPEISRDIEKKSEVFFYKFFKNIKDKNDILDLKIDKILIGDLLYDTYIKAKKLPTLDIQSYDFKLFFKEFISLCYFWIEYFNRHNVKAVICSHQSYTYALPLRVANKNNILSLVVSSKTILKHDHKVMYGYGDYRNYNKEFLKFKKNIQKEALKLSAKHLNKRFSGLVGPDADMALYYADKSSFNNNKPKTDYIKKSKNFKILICTHDFFDAVHLYGKFLFSDFYEWLNYLGNISKKTQHDWYIKNHPKYGGKFVFAHSETEKIVLNFLKYFPNIKLLPDNLSHKFIINSGIDLVLTVYGTVGMEYPYFGVPVMNAGANNPHIAYNFNIHPKNLKEFHKVLFNIPKIINLKKAKNQILQYYFMNYLNLDDNWLFSNYVEMLKDIGGFHSLSTNKIYSFFYKKIHLKEINTIEKKLNNFFASEKIRI